MLIGIPLPRRATALGALLFILSAAPGAAQFRDARLPESGRLWFELTPTLLDWSEQFAANSADAETSDGSREPLFSHYDGPLAARLFPGPAFFIDDLNTDATALGFDPITEEEFSLGDLDYSRLRAQARRLTVGFELGILDRLSVGFHAPFTRTDIETSFAFDSTTANVTSAADALPSGSQFFVDAQSSLASLQALIDSGVLTGPELTDALLLRDDTDLFLTTLERRSVDGALIPTAPSIAGVQMDQRFSAFVSQFEALGLMLPALGLPGTGTSADFLALFIDPPFVASNLGNNRNALSLGEIEISVRFGVIDHITPRGTSWDPVGTPQTPEEPPTTEPGAGAVEGEATGTPSVGPTGRGSTGIRLRTTLGVTARIPIRSASFPPFANAANFLDLPIGDGQTDIELALYQDVAFDDWLVLRTSARYGIQKADDLILRVAPPDQPYAFESLQTVVHRDLGDYLHILVRPALRINSALSFNLEYEYFRLGDPSYTLAQPLPDAPDASPLEIEGSQTRHRIGAGVIFDLTEARNRDELIAGGGPLRRPWQFGISIRKAVAGSGGQTPASFRVGAHFRVPIDIF